MPTDLFSLPQTAVELLIDALPPSTRDHARTLLLAYEDARAAFDRTRETYLGELALLFREIPQARPAPRSPAAKAAAPPAEPAARRQDLLVPTRRRGTNLRLRSLLAYDALVGIGARDTPVTIRELNNLLPEAQRWEDYSTGARTDVNALVAVGLAVVDHKDGKDVWTAEVRYVPDVRVSYRDLGLSAATVAVVHQAEAPIYQGTIADRIGPIFRSGISKSTFANRVLGALIQATAYVRRTSVGALTWEPVKGVFQHPLPLKSLEDSIAEV